MLKDITEVSFKDYQDDSEYTFVVTNHGDYIHIEKVNELGKVVPVRWLELDVEELKLLADMLED